MATTRNATYKQYNGTDWDTVYFRTSAGLVGESSTLYFLRPATHTVNGKSFYSGTAHQGITLYAEDITLNSSSSITIKGQLDTHDQEIANLEDTINKLDYAASDHNHDDLSLKQLKLRSPSSIDITTGQTIWTGFTYGSAGQVLKTDGEYVYWDNDHDTTYSVATKSSDGLMSAEDKKNLDALYEAVNDDGVVNKLNEVFAMFEGMDDETTIITEINKKVNTSSILTTTAYTELSTLIGAATNDTVYSSSAVIQLINTCSPNDHDHDNLSLDNLSLKQLKLRTPSSIDVTTGQTIWTDFTYGSAGQVLKTDGEYVYWDNDRDTKNTAGSTNSSSKLFLIGATSQATNPQTYSHDTAYVGTDGCLYSGGNKVSTTTISTGSTTPSSPKSGDIWIFY